MTALTDFVDLQPLWKAVHDRLCRGDATARSKITIPDASPEVRRAVDRLLGRVSSAGQLNVQLGKLDEALGRAGTTAATIAASACGPIIDRSVARANKAASSQQSWDTILDHPAAREPALWTWLQQMRVSGALARSGGEHAVMSALDVLAFLPHDGEPIGRPVLAAAILGGEHYLDDNTSAGRLVTAGLAARLEAPTPADAATRAALWAAAGVTFDAVSTLALTLGLRPIAAGPLTEAAARWADSGIPLPIPAAAVAAETWRLADRALVSVCENPSVIEAASNKFRAQAPPMLCVSGMPGRAITSLLDQLVKGGARIRYHGDFGTGGIAIANLVIARHNAEPWLMTTADHQRAVDRLRQHTRQPRPLRGRIPTASWDPDLAASIIVATFEVTEEHVLAELLDDLATPESTG
jgi:uncharacterized protein (TIGR02679 family)